MEAGATKKEPKVEAPKGGEDELSMEEILQSIRRIIADDDNEGKKTVGETKNGKGKAEEARDAYQAAADAGGLQGSAEL
ncbi:MAG: hypothetical protein K2Q01_04630, partial [Rickettsiales bacterium]|nr:hypothetical protein [Rickettsiales bacterium]